jgi:hypothetical protein
MTVELQNYLTTVTAKNEGPFHLSAISKNKYLLNISTLSTELSGTCYDAG